MRVVIVVRCFIVRFLFYCLGKKGNNGGNGNLRSGNGRGRGSNSHSKSWPGPDRIRSCETNTSRGNAFGFQYPQVCNCLSCFLFFLLWRLMLAWMSVNRMMQY